jgi:hypothetical protein
VGVEWFPDMSDDFEPFFSSSQADSVSDEYPYLKSLDVEVEMTKLGMDQVGYKRYDETDLPSHVPCPECGTNAAIGWKVADHIDQKHTQFSENVSCKGQEHENKSCVVSFEIEGTADYV